MDNCIFCKIIKGEIPSKKLYEDDKVVIIMDINPVVDGHVLVIPKEHIVDYTEMPDDLKEAMNEDGELKYGEAHLLMNLFLVFLVMISRSLRLLVIV